MKRFMIGVLIAVTCITLLAVVVFFSVGFFLSPQSKLSKSDAIVAISGGETVSRTDEAISLYQAGWAPVLIFSGAARDASGPSNAAHMKQVAMAAGVPAEAILIDEAATNTQQNAEGVASIARDHGYRSIILVTSPYHQRRASLTFRRALDHSVAIINHSTTDHAWRRSAWWANDYSYNLTLSELRKTLYTLIFERS
jgi:uncharacterized SAM-binding protein YcdF (DUF218 family)